MAERFDELVKLVQEGRRLKDEDRAVPADAGFDLWLHNVTEYLLKTFSPQRALEWQALPDSPLIYGGHYYEDERTWVRFHSIIRERIEWLGKLQLRGSDGDALEVSSLSGLSHLDSDLRDRCLPLVKANPTDPKVWDSAVRTAGVILEERLRRVGNIKDNSVGRDLVNRIFGKAGTLAKHFDGDSERDGYRDLFAGIVGAFRNPSAHRLIDPNPEEGSAYIVFVNLLLKHLASLTEPGSTTRATREGFLAACGDAAPFFAEVLDEACIRKLQVSFGGKGFSVRAPHWRKRNPKRLATLETFEKTPELVWQFYEERRQKIRASEPNAAHKAVVELALHCTDFLLVTQNVDDLHERADYNGHRLTDKQIVRIHGRIFSSHCTNPACNFKKWDRDIIVPITAVPECPRCGGNLRPGVVWFDEDNDPVQEHRVEKFLKDGPCDVVVVFGTSATFEYIRDWVLRAAVEGAWFVEINPSETPLTRFAHHILHGDAAKTLPNLVHGAIEHGPLSIG